MDEIPNKIQQSQMMQIDLAELLPQYIWKGIDIADFLEEGFILREKPFRNALKQWEVDSYKNAKVYLYCSTQALFPEWVYLLWAEKLKNVHAQIYIGNEKEAKSQALEEVLQTHNYEVYHSKSIILKGCGNTFVSPQNLTTFFTLCMPFARSIMYGEACSAVPLYKSPK